MKKLNSMPDYTAKLPKSPHDLSQSFTFTACPGMLLPVYYDMLHFGDEIHFSAAEFVRLNPLKNPALGDIDVHLDYFFVPLSVMYTPSPSMFYQTDDLLSSNFDKNAQGVDWGKFPVHNFGDYFQDVGGYADQPDGLPLTEFDCFGNSQYRMFDFLDMQPNLLLKAFNADMEGVTVPNYTPWFALAYQAIYQLHTGYRNTDRELKSYNYNIDKYYQSRIWTEPVVTGSSTSQESVQKNIFSLRYVNRYKDYFNSVKVSPMGSAVSMLSSPETVFNSVNAWLADISPIPVDNEANFVPYGSTSTDIYLPLSSVQSIRQAFMIDKLYRVIGRADKNYESQFLAHYGIKIPHDSLHNITHIGHDMAKIVIDAVVSNSDTFNSSTGDGAALGEIGGQGSVMLKGNKYNFKAPFHGVFMAIAYCVPRMRYIAGLNKLHQLNAVTDFWQPEFDRRGMQPLFDFEVHDGANMTDRLGWQFAYEQFKRKFDKVSHAFQPLTVAESSTGNVNSYSPWVVSQFPFGAFNSLGSVVPGTGLWYDFYSRPTDLNGIFQVPHNTHFNSSVFGDGVYRPYLIYQTDPFICDFHMRLKKVNAMSEYGEPEL